MSPSSVQNESDHENIPPPTHESTPLTYEDSSPGSMPQEEDYYSNFQMHNEDSIAPDDGSNMSKPNSNEPEMPILPATIHEPREITLPIYSELPHPDVSYADKDRSLSPIMWNEWVEDCVAISIPPVDAEETERIEQLSSLQWNDFYSHGDPTTHPEKAIVYKAYKRKEAELVIIYQKLKSSEVKQNKTLQESYKKMYFRAMLKMGHICLLGQDWGRAHSAYKIAYFLDKDKFGEDPGAYFGFGLVYYHFKRFKLAIESFITQLYLFPDLELVPDIHCRLGSSYKHQEEYALALKHYTAAFADYRDSWFHSKTQLRICIALCHSLSGDLQKAYDDLKILEDELATALQALSDPPTSPLYIDRATVLRELGWVCYQFDDPETRADKLAEAEKYLTQSRDLEPQHGKTFYYLGRCYGENKQRAHDAFLNYRQAIDKSEGDADTWCSIGLLYQDQNQPMDALQAFICAVELNPEHSPAWTNLGQLYLSQAKFQDALQCFKNALQYNPVCPGPLKQHIAVLEREISNSQTHSNTSNSTNSRSSTAPQQPLPVLQEAWKQPIPSELRQRQNEANLVKQFRYREGSQLWKMSDLGIPRKRARRQQDAATPQSDCLSGEQVAMVEILEANEAKLDDVAKTLREQLKLKNPPSGSGGVSPVNPGDLAFEDADGTEQHDTVSGIEAFAFLRKSIEEEAENGGSKNDKPYVKKRHRLPNKFNLMAPLNVPLTITADGILDMAVKRVEKSPDYVPIFDEDASPPEPPKAPELTADEQAKLKLSSENGYRLTPLINVESRNEAQLISLQQYLQSPKCPIAVVRGLVGALRMDLSLYSTKSLMEIIPDRTIEVRTQYRMKGEQNVNAAGVPTWFFYSKKGSAKVLDYAQYQAQSFKFCLKEEEEKLRKTGAKYGQTVQESSKRSHQSESTLPIKFGTNIDISDYNIFPKQLKELQKLPGFCRPGGSCDMLSHLGYPILGMNTVQMYLKVPQARTPAHIENNCFASVNINIGPGDCEWFGVPYEYWSKVNEMCNEHGMDFLRGSYWPDVEELLKSGVPVYRFTQKAGDLVWVGPGCVHWVQATGWCNNIAWNVGPLTAFQMEVSLISYEWNKKRLFNSLVPMQLLCWQLAKNVQFTVPGLWQMIRAVLIRSLAYCKMIETYVKSVGKKITFQPRQIDAKGREPTCVICEVEVFNILFVKQGNPEKTESAYFNYCVYCAKKKKFHKDNDFYVLQQITFDELIAIFNKCQLTYNAKKLNLVA